MDWMSWALLVSLAVSLIMGMQTWRAAPRNLMNQSVAVLSVGMSIWLVQNLLTLHCRDAASAERLIRWMSSFTALLPPLCHAVRLVIDQNLHRWRDLLREIRPWLIASFPFMLLCWTPFFMAGVSMPGMGSGSHLVVAPAYGPAVVPYAAYFIVVMGAQLSLAWKSRARLDAPHRLEMGFLLTATLSATVVGILIGLAGGIATGKPEFAPASNAASVAVLMGVLAYGMATRRILNEGEFLARSSAWVVTVIAACVLFTGVWHLLSLEGTPNFGTGLLSALAAMTFALWMERVFLAAATRLFLPRGDRVDQQLFDALRKMLRKVGRREDLLDAFAREAGQVFGAVSVRVLRFESGVWREESRTSGARIEPAAVECLAAAFSAGELPVGEWESGRTGLHPLRHRAACVLPGLASAAFGVRVGERLDTMVLMGPRANGGIYGATELDRLYLLGAQFGLALENSELYANVEHARSFNETLLRRLPCGVALFDSSGSTRLLNEEARRILPPEDSAPASLRPALEETLRLGSLAERDLHLEGAQSGGEDALVVRIRAVRLALGAGLQEGVLVVLNNITHLRQLEAEIRRRAEESAIGILAAQTAHEIKNPLVTLKTFAALLPTHYDDMDFRANFAPLVAREVERINQTVQDLLQFSGPVEPDFQLISAHALVRQIMATAEKQNQGRPLSFTCQLSATSDMVRADPRLLSLAVENLLTNATEAMEAGRITVESHNAGADGACLFCLEIRDDGPGIPPDKIKDVFKPFFTTKATGSGLGLSQSQRIIEAHGGRIVLESEPGRGTLLRILVPALCREEAAG